MRTRQLILAAIAAVLVLAGCTDSGDGDKSGKGDPGALAARLATAKDAIDGAETIDIALSTTKIPSGVSGLLAAKGRGNHSPAFMGKVTVITGGSSLGADVIATEGKVWAKTSFAPVYLSIDPASLRAPDPATLLASDGGITEILLKTEKLTDGGRSRDGSDVLTTIKGTLPGAIVSSIIPSADVAKDFAVTYRLDDDDHLHDARLSGPFYPGADDVTYSVTLLTSESPVTIEAPTRPGR